MLRFAGDCGRKTGANYPYILYARTRVKSSKNAVGAEESPLILELVNFYNIVLNFCANCY